MNKNIIYIGIAVVAGLLAGWLIFGNSSGESATNKESTELADNHDHSDNASQMWTCSMHPQIMQQEPGDCPICGMDLIPADTGADGLSPNEIKMTENAVALANIQTTTIGDAKESSEDGIIALSGKIATNEENKSIQASYFDGRIENLKISFEGEKINRGQLLATIYAPTLVAAQQELITAASLKESQPGLYNAVRNKLKNWKLSESQINAIESSGKVRENFPLYATVSGTVSEVMAREGDYVKQGQPILKVSNFNSVWAEFDAYENQIANLKVGQPIKIEANAYPNREFDAIVSFIDPVLNAASRTVTVRATLKNTEDLFKPGMFVRGKLKAANQPTGKALVVPASAVMWTGERSLVYIKTNPNEPVFEMREVVIGNRSGDTYTITEGLRSGDEIVTNGTFTVDAAAQLQGKRSMMNEGKKSQSEKSITEMKMEFPESFAKNFKNVIKPYLQMKDALITGETEKVSAFAKAASNQLQQISKENLGKMEEAHLVQSIDMLDAMVTNEILENQRYHFVVLNENLVPIAMSMDNLPTLYVQKCPMANKNKGAFWMSSEKEIRNPYYGDAMMTCGSIVEEIK